MYSEYREVKPFLFDFIVTRVQRHYHRNALNESEPEELITESGAPM